MQLTVSRAMSIFNFMVEYLSPELDGVFHALGDATRRQMLRELATSERTVGELAKPFDMSLAAASKHIKALEAAGLVQREVRGRTHLCRLDARPLASAHQWLLFYEDLWSQRLDVLARLLREQDERAEPAPAQGKPKRAPAGGARPASRSTPKKGKQP